MNSAVPHETPAPLRPRHLLRLAGCSLLLSTGVATIAAVTQSHADTVRQTWGSAADMYFSIAAGLLWLHALLAGVVPAVLAEGYRIARCGLVAVHVVAVWLIQISGYATSYPIRVEMMVELAGMTMLATLGLVTGLMGALLLMSMLWGWTLTRRVEDVPRPTFSVRGMLIATAAAAALFASPRIIVPVMTPVVELIHGYWQEERAWSGTTLFVESESVNIALPIIYLLVGALLAISLGSAMWIGRSRIAWPGLLVGPLIAASLALAAELLTSTPRTPTRPVGAFLVVFVFFLVGSMLTTLQIALWHRSGWRLVRIRPGTSGSAANAGEFTS